MNRDRDRPAADRDSRDRTRIAGSTDKAADSEFSSSVSDLGQIGNRALLSLIKSGRLQRKSRISQPGDPLETEADRAADRVGSGQFVQISSTPAASTGLQRSSTGDEQLAASLGLGSTAQVESSPADLLAGLPGGQTLDKSTQLEMERQFGEYFGDVRIHTGHRAAETAESIQARAFTAGENIVFGDGQFAPETTEGRRLLAHELAHVVQQRRTAGPLTTDASAERDATDAGQQVLAGSRPIVKDRALAGTVQRDGNSPETPEVLIFKFPFIHRTVITLAGASVVEYDAPSGSAAPDYKGLWIASTRTYQLVVKCPDDADFTIMRSSEAALRKTIKNFRVSVSSVHHETFQANSESEPVNITTNFTDSWTYITKVIPPSPQPVPKPTPRPEAPADADPASPRRHDQSELDPDIRGAFAPQPTASKSISSMSDGELSGLSAIDRASELWNQALDTEKDLELNTIIRLLDTTPDGQVTQLQDQLFYNNSALLRELARRIKGGDDAQTFINALARLWKRGEFPDGKDDGQAHWSRGLFGSPVKLTRTQYDEMLKAAPLTLQRQIDALNQQIAFDDSQRAWRNAPIGSLVDAIGGLQKPLTAAELTLSPEGFLRNPYGGTAYASTLLSQGRLFESGTQITSTWAQNKDLKLRWSGYRSDYMLYEDDAKAVIWTAKVGGVVVMAVAMPEVVIPGIVYGAGFDVVRQTAEMHYDPNQTFDAERTINSGLLGGALAPVFHAAPGLMYGMSAYGAYGTVKEVQAGRPLVAAVDAFGLALPFAAKGAGRFAKSNTGRALAFRAAMGMKNVQDSMFVGDIPNFNSTVMVDPTYAPRPSTSALGGEIQLPGLNAGSQQQGSNPWVTVQIGESGLPSRPLPRFTFENPDVARAAADIALLGTSNEAYAPHPDNPNKLTPRQLSLFDIAPTTSKSGKSGPAAATEINRLMRFLYQFNPKPGGSYLLNGSLYSFDAQGRLVRVSSNRNMYAVRETHAYKNYPNKTAGYDYGHVGGTSDFGNKDILIGNRGGYPLESAFNRTGAWRQAEIAMSNTVAALEAQGKPFLKVSEVRNFVNDIPLEWRLYVESEGRIVYDSTWLTQPAP